MTPFCGVRFGYLALAKAGSHLSGGNGAVADHLPAIPGQMVADRKQNPGASELRGHIRFYFGVVSAYAFPESANSGSRLRNAIGLMREVAICKRKERDR